VAPAGLTGLTEEATKNSQVAQDKAQQLTPLAVHLLPSTQVVEVVAVLVGIAVIILPDLVVQVAEVQVLETVAVVIMAHLIQAVEQAVLAVTTVEALLVLQVAQVLRLFVILAQAQKLLAEQ
jgi:hypothetical protein